jgi:hypothetical protein
MGQRNESRPCQNLVTTAIPCATTEINGNALPFLLLAHTNYSSGFNIFLFFFVFFSFSSVFFTAVTRD